MAKRRKFETPHDLIDYYSGLSPYLVGTTTERQIRDDAAEITQELLSHFGDKYDILEVIQSETYKPPFATEWSIKEKEELNGAKKQLRGIKEDPKALSGAVSNLKRNQYKKPV
jgi:hypothetical protein